MGKVIANSMRGAVTPAEVRAAIHEACRKNNYDPFKELIKIATDTQVIEVGGNMVVVPLADVDQRITIAKELASYLAPKLRSVELEAQIDASWTIKIQKFEKDASKEVIAAEASKRFLENSLPNLVKDAAVEEEGEDA